MCNVLTSFVGFPSFLANQGSINHLNNFFTSFFSFLSFSTNQSKTHSTARTTQVFDIFLLVFQASQPIEDQSTARVTFWQLFVGFPTFLIQSRINQPHVPLFDIFLLVFQASSLVKGQPSTVFCLQAILTFPPLTNFVSDLPSNSKTNIKMW